jgi:hypothetical protein
MCTNYYTVTVILNLLLQQLVCDTVLSGKLTLYGRVLEVSGMYGAPA